MLKSSERNKRLAKNTGFLYIRMFFVLVISLYTSRVIINALGVEDFGIYNVVSGFVSLFAFMKATMSASMQRFYNYALGKFGDEGIQKVYSTGFKIHVVISIILLLVFETFGLYYINNIMVIPEERLFAANIVYQAAVISMITVIMQIPYLGIVLAYEKMDFYAIVSIVDVILKLLIAIILPFVSYDKLVYYGIFLLLISVLNFLSYYVYSKRQLLKVHLTYVDRTLSKEMFVFAGWNLMGTFAFMIKDQGLNMLLNVYFGPLINAARGISFQIKSAIGGFTQSITTAFRPQIVDSYAKDGTVRVRNLFYLESKICFSLILVLIIPIIFEINFILNVWIGDIVPQYSNLFTILVLLDSLICSINPSMNHVVHATGKLKNYQKANSIVNILIIPVSWICLFLGGNPISVFIIAILFSILNQTVCALELNKLFNINLRYYARKVLLSCISVAIISVVPFIGIVCLMPDNALRLVIVVLLDLVISPLLIYKIVLNVEERLAVRSLIINKIKK